MLSYFTSKKLSQKAQENVKTYENERKQLLQEKVVDFYINKLKEFIEDRTLNYGETKFFFNIERNVSLEGLCTQIFIRKPLSVSENDFIKEKLKIFLKDEGFKKYEFVGKILNIEVPSVIVIPTPPPIKNLEEQLKKNESEKINPVKLKNKRKQILGLK